MVFPSSLAGAESQDRMMGSSAQSVPFSVIAVSVVLLFAGSVKLVSLAPELNPTVQYAMSENGRLWLIAMVEIALGCWLICTRRNALAPQAVAALFFAAFFGHAVFSAWLGQTSCRCFGAIQTPIFLSMGISLFCLLCLLVR